MPSSEDSAGHYNPSRVSIDNGHNNNKNNNKWCTYMREQLFGSLCALRVSNDHFKEFSIIYYLLLIWKSGGWLCCPQQTFDISGQMFLRCTSIVVYMLVDVDILIPLCTCLNSEHFNSEQCVLFLRGKVSSTFLRMFSLYCFVLYKKSGNAFILRGDSEAVHFVIPPPPIC